MSPGFSSVPRGEVSQASAMGNTEPGFRRKGGRDQSPGPEYGQAPSAFSVRRSS